MNSDVNIKNKNVLVSVVVPCYNHEAFVGECITSIVNQTYKNIQLIVIDDGSADKSFDVIKALSEQHNFIAEKQTNRGISATLNKAISKYATGEFICLVASDDFWELDKIEKQVPFMQSNANYGMVCGRSKFIDEKGYVSGEEVLYNAGNRYSQYSFSNLLKANQVSALTVMFKRKVWQELGGFDENSPVEDWDMWLRIADKYEIGFQKEFMGFWRVHSSNTSSNQLKMTNAALYICEKWKHKPEYRSVKQKLVLEKISILAKENKSAAFRNLLQNISYAKDSRYWKAVAKLLFVWVK